MVVFLELAPEFLLLAAMLFALLALEGYMVSFHPVFLAIAWLLDQVQVHVPGIGGIGPGSWLARQVHRFDKWIQHLLSQAVLQTEQHAVQLFYGTAHLFEAIVGEVASLAHDTANGLERLGGKAYGPLKKLITGVAAVLIGRAVRHLLSLLLHPLHSLQRLMAAIRHSVAVLERDLGHWRGYTARQLRALLRRLSRLGWLAGVASIAALGNLILKRLHLKWLTGYRTLAALGLAILAQLGLQWTRCGNTTKAGRGVCGLDSDLLDALLLDTLGILGAISLVEFTHDLQDITEPAVSIMRGFIREF